MKHRPIRHAALAVALVVGLQACTGPSKAELLASAKTSISRSDWKTAIIQLKSVLQRDPDSGEARYLLGQALLDSGDAPGASLELRAEGAQASAYSAFSLAIIMSASSL